MTTFTRWPRLMLGLLLAGGLAACDKNDNPDDDDGSPPPAVPTVTLAAAPTTLVQGAATTLTWSSTNATACAASGAWTGARGVSGSEANTPAAAGSASYTLTCTGAGGSGTATATVTVTAPPPPAAPTVTLSAAPTSIALGSPTTLSWSSTNATACTASGAWSGARAVSGSQANTPAAAGTASYTLTCTGAGGSANASATVTVNPLPTVTISADPATLTLGAASTLTWSSTNATACTASGAWTGDRASSGTASVTPVATGSIPYTLSCTGPGGSAAATASITVNPVPTLTLSAAPATVIIGNSSTLTWSSSNTTACTASGGWSGTRAVSGTEAVTPAAVGSASYTLTCTGPGGSVAATSVVTVNPIPTVSLTFEGRAVSAGGATGDGALANAAIRVTAGGQNFTGTADAAGNFSIPVTILESEQDRLVRIFATEASATPIVVYVSQLASFRTLLTQAGPDFTLSDNENFRVNVSNVATAETALVQEAAFGFPANDATVRPPLLAAAARPRSFPVTSIAANDGELEAALMSINQTELLDIAVSLSLVADRGFALPADIDSTLGLALTPAARQQLINDARTADAAVVDETLGSLLANPSAVMGTSVADVPRIAISAITGASTEENLIGNGGGSGGAASFRFDADGRGTYADSSYSSESSTWSVNGNGVIEIRFPVPPSVNIERFIDDPDSEEGFRIIICTLSLTAVDVRPISTTTARRTDTQAFACPEAPELDEQFQNSVTSLFVAPGSLPPITAADVSGQTLGLRIADPFDIGFGSGPFGFPGDLLSFNADGTGTTRAQALTFTWSIDDDGALVVNVSNGIQSRFRKLREVVDGIDLYFSEYSGADARRTLQQPAFRANGALTFTPANVVGTHYNAGVGAVFPLESVDFARPATEAETALLKGFVIEVFDNGFFDQTADRLVTNAEGQVIRSFGPTRSTDIGNYWRIMPDGSLVFRRYVSVPPRRGEGTGCGFDGAEPGCALLTERIVEPYFLHGNRQGWFERLRIFDLGTGELNDECVRTFYYIRRPNGDWVLPREDANPLRQQPSNEPFPEITMDDLRGRTGNRSPMIDAIRSGRAVMN